MTLSFMIKKKYLEEKVRAQEKSGKFKERRAYTPFWRSRIGSVHQYGTRGAFHRNDAVFICGHHVWRADILGIEIEETPSEVIGLVGKMCYAIECRFDTDELEWLQVKFPVRCEDLSHCSV